MLHFRFALILAVVTLATADSPLSTSSTSPPSSSPSIISSPPPLSDLLSSNLSTDAVLLPGNTTSPTCKCQYNEALQQNELVCVSNLESDSDEDVELDAILNWNCSFVRVEVSHHSLTVIDADAFKTTPQLQGVYLYSDFIETVEREAFRGLSFLVAVDLSDNSLLSVDPLLFANNPQLRTVSLSDNALVNLKTNAPILESSSITHLDLSFCKLTTLTKESFSKLPNLQRLDISNNNIQQLPVTALQSMPELNALKLSNNRWRCDCAFKKVVDFAKSMEDTDSRVRCFTPDKMMEYWTEKSEEKYCPVQSEDEEYDDSSSEEYDDEVEEPGTIHIGDMILTGNQLEQDTRDLRQDMNQLVGEEDVTTPADDGLPEVVVDDMIIVLEGDEGDEEDDQVDVFPAAVLVFVLAALIVFGVGVSVALCKAVCRRGVRREGWSELEEEGGGEPVYVKVPLE